VDAEREAFEAARVPRPSIDVVYVDQHDWGGWTEVSRKGWQAVDDYGFACWQAGRAPLLARVAELKVAYDRMFEKAVQLKRAAAQQSAGKNKR
jgi:hypothetical protein